MGDRDRALGDDHRDEGRRADCSGDRHLPRPFTKVIELLAPAILAGLIVIGTFTDADGDLVLDARAAGLGAAAAVYAVSRKSLVAAVAAAAITAALVRALA